MVGDKDEDKDEDENEGEDEHEDEEGDSLLTSEHGRTGRDVRDVRVRPWCRTKDGVGLSLP